MIFYILSYLGGALTILAPCILPVLPFVFARVDRPFMKSGLPLLGGMALTFAVVGTLAAVAGNWAMQANQYGRLAALALLALMGLALIAPRWAERLGRTVVALGSRFSSTTSKASGNAENFVLPAFFTGMATGLL